MIPTMKKLIIALHLASFSIPAIAVETPSLFKEYITKNSIYIEKLNQKAEDIFKYTFPLCEEKIKVSRLKPTILLSSKMVPTQDSLIDHPDHGQWIESSMISGCAQKIKFNILSTAYNSSSPPLLHPLINGRTKIEALNQSKAEQAIRETLRTSRNCRSSKTITNTTFYGYRTPNPQKLSAENQNMGWLEKWDVDACGKTESVNLAILPDPRTKYKYVAKVNP